MKRSTPLRQRTRINPVSARRRKRDAVYADRRKAAFERSGGLCEACVKDWAADCDGRAAEIHHIAGRGGSDPHRLDNLLAVSSEHHRRIHAEPALSYSLGFMVKRNGVAA